MFAPVPLPPSTCRVIPLTLDTPPFAFDVVITSCFGPGRKLVFGNRFAAAFDARASTLRTIVSGVVALPGVQLTMPPLALVSVWT